MAFAGKSPDEVRERLVSYYGPRAEQIKRDLRYWENERFETDFSHKYLHDRQAIFARVYVNEFLTELCPGTPGYLLKSPLTTIWAIIRAAFDKENWAKLEADSRKMSRARAIRKFCKRMAGVAGNTALTEVIYQLMHDGLVRFLELGGLWSALCATVAVNAVFMVVKAIKAQGGFHFGKNIDVLREDFSITSIAATVAGMFKGEELEVVLAGVVIAFLLGTMLPVVYPKMARAWTVREFLDGALEVLGWKEIAPEKDYVIDAELENLIKNSADDLFCPISMSLMRHPVSIHGQVFEFDEIEKAILQNGEDTLHRPATVRELQEIPKLKALIDELVEEFGIELK